jgi:origin recognition complex subunit 2
MASSETSASSDSEVEAIIRTASKHASDPGFIHQTSFDAYFLQSSRASKTSTNVFSDLIPPLSREEYAAAIEPVKQAHIHSVSLDSARPWFKQYIRELEEGFNLLFFGFGSKRDVLNAFAREICSRRGHVIIVNAYRPDFSLKDLFASAERIPGLADEPLLSSGIEGQTQRLQQFFARERNKPPLFITVHNIDAPSLRSHKAAAILGTLASSPRIHVVASVDHINSPLLFPLSDTLSRKHLDDDAYGAGHAYAWLWHDLTTLAPYDVELAYADPGSISGATLSGRAAQAALSAESTVAMTETAAHHILASVTQRAKKLFVLVAKKQLDAMEEAGETAIRDLQKFGIPYDNLFVVARDQFVATSDGALRSLLGEFKDHGLIVSTTSEAAGGKETLHIPLRKERLAKVLQACEQTA